MIPSVLSLLTVIEITTKRWEGIRKINYLNGVNRLLVPNSIGLRIIDEVGIGNTILINNPLFVYRATEQKPI